MIMPGTAPFPLPDPGHPALRIGLWCPEDMDPAFFHPVLDGISRCSFTTLAAVIRDASGTGQKLHPAVRADLPARTYRWLDGCRRAKRIKVLRHACAALLAPLPAIEAEFGSKLPAVVCDQNDPVGLDLILWCGFSSAPEANALARHGAWRFVFTGADGTPREAYGLDRLTDGDPNSRINLVAEPPDGSEARLLGRSVLTRPRALSLVDAAEVEGRAAAELIVWMLWKLHSHGQEFTKDCPPFAPTATQQARRKSLGAIAALASALGRKVLQWVERRWRLPASREWQIGIRPASGRQPWEGAWEDFRWIEAAPGHYLADPFLIQHDQTTWLFAEDYVYETAKGRLVCAPLDANGLPGSWTTVLELPCHLSYPYVFEHDGAIWMIPESGAGGSVDLYRATRFPDCWTYVRRLWDGPGVDTVATVGDDGYWYFFTSVQSSSQLPPQLLLFSAPDLMSPWTLHPSSPIALDVRLARNGGRIQYFPDAAPGHRLIRVSQDGTGRYGSQLRFSRIVELNARSFREVPCGDRLPPEGRIGAHHHERFADWEVIDAARLVEPYELAR